MMGTQAGDTPRTWAEITQLNALGIRVRLIVIGGVTRFVEWLKKYSIK